MEFALMSLTPISPATAAMPGVVTPPTPVQADNSVQVTPVENSQKNSQTGSATADNAGQQPNTDSTLPMDRALKKINDEMQAWSTQVQFSIDPDTHRVVVSIKDSKTGDVIETIPSETVLHIAKMITKMQGTAIQASA
jgi:flagellar protein FlaG